MKIVLRVLLLAAVIALGVWLWVVFFPSPEKAIRKRLAELAAEVSFTANQSPVANALAANRLTDYFSPDAEVVIDLPQLGKYAFEGRDDILQAVVRARTVLTTKVQFVDIVPVFGPDKKTANIELTAKITVSGERDFVPQELNILMKEVDRKWVVTHLETVEVLK